MKRGYVEYTSNNSGGSWWLNDDQWKALEEAGWKVAWQELLPVYNDDGDTVIDDDGMPKMVHISDASDDAKNMSLNPMEYEDGECRFLGARATMAYRAGLSLREAVEEWERVTGESATDSGCPCCGQPHYFTEYDQHGAYVDSGPTAKYECEW